MSAPKKVALVTGAGSGIGRATALKLASLGYALALVARTPRALEEVAGEIKNGGGEALVLAADFSKSAGVERAVGTVAKEWGRVDVLVNSVGVAPVNKIALVSDAEWENVLATNLSSAFYATRAVWPVMNQNGGGVIVNVSSMAAKDPFAGLGAYAVAKSGVNMLTLVTGREGEAYGIRVHCVAPGAVETPMLRKVLSGAAIDPAFVMQPEEIAEIIAGMVHGHAEYKSGETVYVHR